MNTPVSVKKLPAPPLDEEEIFRYLRCKNPDDALFALVRDCIKEAEAALEYRVCHAAFDVSVNGDIISFPFGEIASADLAKRLSKSSSVIIFGATVGLGLDRLIYKYGKLSPSRAVVLQAMGAERIEALCDAFCKEADKNLEKCGKKTVSRFSAGYGDLSLDTQRIVFDVLSLEKNIGATLNESLLMSPTKSVTAFVGIENV